MEFTQIYNQNLENNLLAYDDMSIDHQFHHNVEGFPDTMSAFENNPQDYKNVHDSFFDFAETDIFSEYYQDHGNDNSTMFLDPNSFSDISEEQFTLPIDDKSKISPNQLEMTDNKSTFPEISQPAPAPQLEVDQNNVALQELVVFEAKKKEGGGNNNGKVTRARSKSSRLDMDVIRNHFHLPISRAAEEMNVGLTVLKMKCRELNITRWPYRKLKSLKSLITNVKEMGLTNHDEIEILEEHHRMLEKTPYMEITEKIKKLRQASFKASYKKRKSLAIASSLASTSAAPASYQFY